MQRGALVTSAWGTAAGASLAAALWLAAHHPLAPLGAIAAVIAWFAIAWHWPRLWLCVLPALLPAANLAPWTGWILVDEFDLLVLGAVAAGYARLARSSAADPVPGWRGKGAIGGLLALTTFGVWRGVMDTPSSSFGWFDGYADPLNAARVAKSAFEALLLLPLLHRQWHADATAAMRRFALGMLGGIVLVIVAAVWERLAYPGLLDFSAPYRTTAWFWEMHVGGAAIDVYIALATPFVAWALWTARTRFQWAVAALLTLAWAYVCLTTFSRGVYLAVVVSAIVLVLLLPWGSGSRWGLAARCAVLGAGAAALLGLALDRGGYAGALCVLMIVAIAAWLAWRRQRAQLPLRHLAVVMLGLGLIFEVVAVAGVGSFLRTRVERSAEDYSSRLAHWSRGVGLLQSPGEWLWGLGLGRLPENYDRFVLKGEFSGSARLLTTGGRDRVELQGPKSRARLGGLHGLTQRVPLQPTYRLGFDVSAERAARILVRVCTAHLLYDLQCQGAFVDVQDTRGAASRFTRTLAGAPLTRGPWFASRQAVLTLSVLDAGGKVELDHIALDAADGTALLRNGDFASGLAHWLPAAQYYFLPWHIDNLYLELLIERGIVGIAMFLAICALALRRLLVNPAAVGAPFLAAALIGVLCVGMVSSVLDVPRMALLLWLMLALALRPVSGPYDGKR